MNNQIKSDVIIYKDINGEIKLDVSLLQIQRYNEYFLYVNITPKEAKLVLDFDDCQKRPTTKRNRDKYDSKYLGGIDG